MRARLCRWILKQLGWRLRVDLPKTQRFVLIGYPHTSNWDFVLAMLAKGALELRFHFVAKHTLFWFPLSILMRALGGIPVDRRASTGFIGQLVQRFERAKNGNRQLIVGMMPEGTRSYTTHWRSGFYYLAGQASVPLVPGYIDYRKKEMGLGPEIVLTGDPVGDLEKIKQFYSSVEGLNPGKMAPIKFKESV